MRLNYRMPCWLTISLLPQIQFSNPSYREIEYGMMSSGARNLCNLGSLTPGESARLPITGISPYIKLSQFIGKPGFRKKLEAWLFGAIQYKLRNLVTHSITFNHPSICIYCHMSHYL
jgi:hypothetical protein